MQFQLSDTLNGTQITQPATFVGIPLSPWLAKKNERSRR